MFHSGTGVLFLSVVCCNLSMVVLGLFTQNTENSIYLKMDGRSLIIEILTCSSGGLFAYRCLAFQDWIFSI